MRSINNLLKSEVYRNSQRAYKHSTSGCFLELLINSKKVSTPPLFEGNVERFLCLRFSITHTHDPNCIISVLLFKQYNMQRNMVKKLLLIKSKCYRVGFFLKFPQLWYFSKYVFINVKIFTFSLINSYQNSTLLLNFM